MPPLQIAVIASLLASGALLLGALKLSRALRLNLERRVDLIAGRPPRETEAVSSPRRPDQPVWLDEATRRLFSFGVPHRWGLHTRGLVLLGVATASAAIVWPLSFRVLGSSPWLATLLSVLAFFLVPRQLLVREQRRAERQFMDLFPNAIDMIIRMLRAGLPIVSAVRSVGAESPPPFNRVFALVAGQVDIGVPFEDALDVVSERIGIQDFRFFSVAVTLQHATGGNLAATLEILSDVIRKRRAVRLKGIAATAEVRMSAYVLGGMPIVVGAALLILKPDYIAPLFYDYRGKYILGAAVGLLVIAILTMRQMMRRVTAA